MSGNLTGCLKKTPWVQLDDLNLCQSALTRSLGKFFVVRENENRKSGHPMKETLL